MLLYLGNAKKTKEHDHSRAIPANSPRTPWHMLDLPLGDATPHGGDSQAQRYYDRTNQDQ